MGLKISLKAHLCTVTASDTWMQNYAREKFGLPKSTTVTSKGTLAPVGCPDFNVYLQNRLHCPFLVRPRPPPDSRGHDKDKRAPSASSQRAKLGHRYWVEDDLRNKPATPGNTLHAQWNLLIRNTLLPQPFFVLYSEVLFQRSKIVLVLWKSEHLGTLRYQPFFVLRLSSFRGPKRY